MASRNNPNLKSSIIDLLLGALGGIALLVVLFFAMQKINADGNPTKTKKLLFVSIIAAPENWEIGEEFGLLLKDSNGEICYLQPGELTVSGPLQVTWDDRKVELKKPNDAAQRPNDPPFVISVAYDSNATLTLGAWVRGINAPTSSANDTKTYFDRLIAFKGNTPLEFRLNSNWSDSETGSKMLTLKSSNGFFDTVEVIE